MTDWCECGQRPVEVHVSEARTPRGAVFEAQQLCLSCAGWREAVMEELGCKESEVRPALEVDAASDAAYQERLDKQSKAKR